MKLDVLPSGTAILTAACLLSAAAPADVAGTAAPIQAPTATEELRIRVERLRVEGSIEIDGDTVSAEPVSAFYESRGFRPAWTAPDRQQAILRAVESMDREGLRPADYHLLTLTRMLSSATRTPTDSARLDLLLSSALYRIAHDLRLGHVDRTREGWSLEGTAASVDAGTLAQLATSTRLDAAIDSIRPAHPVYTGMREALARYRDMAATGGWPSIPDGPAMRRDSAAGPIALLRRRLAIERYIQPASDEGPPVFDESLENAVRRFQHTHGLNEDGIVGPATRAALNVSVTQRINEIRVNMERARWVVPYLTDRFVAANIAGQKVYYVDHGQIPFETRAVVGTLYRQTPIFSDTMRYIVINPTWTVPRSINNEILREIRSNPDYLAGQRMIVIDRADRPVPIDSIDFSQYTGETFPWTFRQLPGPSNALGRIKFMFPNRYDVYLHDTPARAEFQREERTFSHGCIRIENPFLLAELLLDGQSGPDHAALMEMVASGKTHTIQLEHPLPVLLLYWTAAADLHGELHFYTDVYGRDAAVLRALDGPATRSS